MGDDIRENLEMKLEYKRLERIRRFLCYLAMVNDNFFPYSKSFHLTLSQHLPRQDDSKWKMNDLQWIGHIQGKVGQGKMTREEADLSLVSPSGRDTAPEKFMTPGPRFHSCIRAFEDFFNSDEPPIIVTR